MSRVAPRSGAVRVTGSACCQRVQSTEKFSQPPAIALPLSKGECPQGEGDKKEYRAKSKETKLRVSESREKIYFYYAERKQVQEHVV